MSPVYAITDIGKALCVHPFSPSSLSICEIAYMPLGRVETGWVGVVIYRREINNPSRCGRVIMWK